MKNTRGGSCPETVGKDKKIKIFTLKTFNKILFFFIIVAGVYYFTGINDLTVKGFKLQTAKQKINSLNEENKVMAQKATSLESYSSLSERVKTLSMVAVGSVDYITAESGIVAKK
ncbi:MAG: hypothetical protein WC582_01585 [Patescibacteria group bacterium]